LNSRIRSNNVQVGESVILGQQRRGGALSDDEIIEEERKRKEDDFKKALEVMLIEASSQGRAIVEEAKIKANEIMKTTEETSKKKIQEADIIKREAFEAGKADGFHAGFEEGAIKAKEDIIKSVWGLHALTSSAFKVKKEIINSAEQEILELSTVIAEKILTQQIQIKPEILLNIIKSAVSQLKDKEEIKIIVNPALMQNMYEYAEELKSEIKGLKVLKIIEDKTIPPDGVIVECPESRIDGRLQSQVKEIVNNIMKEFSERSLDNTIPEEIEIRINDKIQ
jgi:flagellar assembly protein FliH